jgi:hypothetical protein
MPVTEAADKPAATLPPGSARGADPNDDHASMVRSLTRVDWLVLLVVALQALVLRAAPTSPRPLYAALAAYTIFVIAFRWRGFPVQDARARIALGAAAMVAFITVVAILTGDSSSPMINLYLLPIVLVSMTLGGRGALVIFAGVALASALRADHQLRVGPGARPFHRRQQLSSQERWVTAMSAMSRMIFAISKSFGV